MIKNKRGQITVFVIVAILMVVAILLLFFLYQNQLRTTQATTTKDTKGEFEDCITGYIEEANDLIFENSGFIERPSLNYLVTNPAGYYKQEDVREVPFLCYTPDEFDKLKNQVTIVREAVEKGIEI